MHILVTRPEPDATLLRKKLEAAGHLVTVEPPAGDRALPPAALPLDGITALIATSRNALRALSRIPISTAPARCRSSPSALAQPARLPILALATSSPAQPTQETSPP